MNAALLEQIPVEEIPGRWRVKTRINGGSENRKKSGRLRSCLFSGLCQVVCVSGDQEFWIKLLFGELLNNAIIHSPEGGYLVASLRLRPHYFHLRLSNRDNDGFDATLPVEIPDSMAENGRGRAFVEEAITMLREAGFFASCETRVVETRNCRKKVVVDVEICDSS